MIKEGASLPFPPYFPSVPSFSSRAGLDAPLTQPSFLVIADLRNVGQVISACLLYSYSTFGLKQF